MNFDDLKTRLNGARDDATGVVTLTPGTLGDSPVTAELLTPFGDSTGTFRITSPTPPEVDVDSETVTIRGTSSFPARVLQHDGETTVAPVQSVPVEAEFRVKGETPAASFWFRLQDGRQWRFADSFPSVPAMSEDTLDLDGALSAADQTALERSVLDFVDASSLGGGAAIQSACFVVKTDSEPEAARAGFQQLSTLARGLNFVARWSPVQFGPFSDLLGSAPSFVVSGQVVLPNGVATPALEAGEFPWDKPQAPGINLAASLNAGVSDLGISLDLSKFRIYSPINANFLGDNPDYEPRMAFEGEIAIPNANLAVTVTAEKRPGADQLVLFGRFSGVSLGRFLAEIAGGTTGTEIIPAAVLAKLPDLTLDHAAIVLENNGAGPQVASISISSTLQNVALDAFGSLLRLELSSLDVLIASPFSSDRRVSARLGGTIAALGTTFSAALDLPEMELFAEQTSTLSLREAFRPLLPAGSPLPPDVRVEDISLAIQFGTSYEFQMSVDPSAAFKVGNVELPRVNVTVSNTGWSFASDDTGSSGIQVGALIAALVEGMTVPEGINELTVSSFSLSHEFADKRFLLTCEGRMPLGTGTAIARFTAEQTQQGTRRVQRFGGTLTLGTFQFDLRFGRQAGSKALIASYSNVNGSPIKVRDFLNQLTNAAPDIDITLNSAILALERTGTTTKVLAGLDMGAGIDLSNLPLVGEALPATERMRLAYRLLVGSQKFTAAQIGSINEALPDGVARLPQKDVDGFAIAGRLEIGSTVIDLDVPVTLRLPSLANPGPPPAGQLPVNPDTSKRSDGINWIPIQKQLGPAHFERIGVQFQSQSQPARLTFFLDASLKAGPLTLLVDGLSVSSPLNEFRPQFNLRGIGLQFQNGPVEISGLFLRRQLADGRDDYSGAATIKAKTFTISAFGSFVPPRDANDQPSIFIFAVLDKALGGPSFFYVTGLAAGFGYNRDLIAPAITGVRQFPLVTAAAGTAKFNELPAVIDAMGQAIPPRTGSYWLAAGVRFTSFRVVESVALLIVKFGNELDILLLGKSTMSLPLPKGTDVDAKAYVFIEMVFMVSVKPAEGLLKAEARLTENSFVIDRACRLSGGFAFYVWFDGPRKGDFVVTLGGYHPRFNVPAHYPRVPRLEINWPNGPVSIKGQAYFALTPSCVMAGGSLEASYKDGSVEAYFLARADFLISWKPFFYDIEVFVNIRAALLIETVFGTGRLGTELSAGVKIWGPQFSGIAHVSWSAISFDVPFGAADDRPQRELLQFTDFRTSFLPPDVCRIRISSGLVREIAKPGAPATAAREWVVRPDEVRFVTETAVPASRAELRRSDTATKLAVTGQDVGVQPVGTGVVNSVHVVTIRKLGSTPAGEIQNPDAWAFDANGVRQAVPKELWHTRNPADQTPPDLTTPPPSAEVLPNHLVGMRELRPAGGGLSAGNPPPMDILDAFRFSVSRNTKGLRLDRTSRVAAGIDIPALDTVPISGNPEEVFKAVVDGNPVDLSRTVPADSEGRPRNVIIMDRIKRTANQDAIRSRRGTAIELARAAGFTDLPDGPLGLLSREAETLLAFPPMLGRLGSPGVRRPRTIAREAPLPDQELPASVRTMLVSLLAELFQWEETDAAGNAVPAGAVRSPRTGTGTETIVEQRPGTPPPPARAGDSVVVGKTVVYSVGRTDRQSPRPALAVTGGANMRLRVVAFDRFGALLQDQITAAAQARLATDAAQVIVTGLPPAEAAQKVFGWRATLPLVQVARRTFLAEGATVRVEGTYGRGPADPVFRVVPGSVAIRENVVTGAERSEETPRGGTFRTQLPEAVQTIAVLVRKTESAAAPGFGTPIEVRRDDGQRLRLLPLHVIRETAAEYVLLCRVPAGLRRDAAGTASFAVTASGGAQQWEISGVVGIAEPVFRVKRDWPAFQLRAAALGRAAAEEARVAIVAAAVQEAAA